MFGAEDHCSLSFLVTRSTCFCCQRKGSKTSTFPLPQMTMDKGAKNSFNFSQDNTKYFSCSQKHLSEQSAVILLF